MVDPERAQTRVSLSPLTALGPLDGRYRDRVSALALDISEFGLIRTRFELEARYLVALSQAGVVRPLSSRETNKLMSFGDKITLEDAEGVKKIEEETRHDVKAMERTFREMVSGTSLEDLTEMIHFGLTSEDINNLSQRLMLKRATEKFCIPAIDGVITKLANMADVTKTLPMIARTHGQPAVPTTVGKELVVFATRINRQTRELEKRELDGKLNGAVGNYNALYFAYPNIDWISFSKKFVASLGLKPNLYTTQINTYEDIVEYFQNYQRINNVVIDLVQDLWRYVSDKWIVQIKKKGEVGSSTMPQKVNPIDFENCEGNMGMANAVFEWLSRKLPVSRLQRDLSDSTATRNIGVALGHSLIGYTSLINGLNRIQVNEEKIKEDLREDWTILAEGVQTVLRTQNISDPYTELVALTRGEHLEEAEWLSILESLGIDEVLKDKLKNLTPATYTGLAAQLTEKALQEIKRSRRES